MRFSVLSDFFFLDFRFPYNPLTTLNRLEKNSSAKLFSARGIEPFDLPEPRILKKAVIARPDDSRLLAMEGYIGFVLQIRHCVHRRSFAACA